MNADVTIIMRIAVTAMSFSFYIPNSTNNLQNNQLLQQVFSMLSGGELTSTYMIIKIVFAFLVVRFWEQLKTTILCNLKFESL